MPHPTRGQAQVKTSLVLLQEPTKYLPLRELFIDPNVQRALNENWVKKLVKNFDPDKFGIIVVSERGPGKYVVIEGQHRIAAVRSLFNDENQLVECKVHRGLKTHEEAALFLAETDKLGMNSMVKFKQKVRAMDPEAVAINQIATQEGYVIDTYYSCGHLSCVSALLAIYRGFGPADSGIKNEALLRQTLIVLREAWPEEVVAMNAYIVSGVALLIASRGKVLDYQDLIQKMRMSKGGAAALMGRARGLAAIVGGRLNHAVADVLVDLYNKNRRTNKLELLH